MLCFGRKEQRRAAKARKREWERRNGLQARKPQKATSTPADTGDASVSGAGDVSAKQAPAAVDASVEMNDADGADADDMFDLNAEPDIGFELA